MDIYLTASQFGKYPGLATSTSVNNCYLLQNIVHFYLFNFLNESFFFQLFIYFVCSLHELYTVHFLITPLELLIEEVHSCIER